MGKFAFAPDAVHLTMWIMWWLAYKWIKYEINQQTLWLESPRLDSPITKGLESLDVDIRINAVCPYQHPIATLVINKENTYIRDNTEEDQLFMSLKYSLAAFLYVIPTMWRKLKIIWHLQAVH